MEQKISTEEQQMLRLFQQEMQQMSQRLQEVEEKIMEMEMIKNSITELQKNSQKEILTPVGGGVFIKSKLTNKDRVLVNVGSGVVIEKPFSEAIIIIGEQINELIKLKASYEEEMEQILSHYQ